uniref:Secreted peptide n=1 Tax=Rhipicephalus pulchellus TaxID=72859 RepID=L7LVD5_RHIPC
MSVPSCILLSLFWSQTSTSSHVDGSKAKLCSPLFRCILAVPFACWCISLNTCNMHKITRIWLESTLLKLCLLLLLFVLFYYCLFDMLEFVKIKVKNTADLRIPTVILCTGHCFIE